MPSVIAVPPAPASPANSTVALDDWWPSIDCNAMRDSLRVGEVVTHARLLAALQGAMLTVSDALSAWRALREADGAAALTAIEPERIVGDETRLEHLFIRAVRFTAMAELAELHRDLSASKEGAAQAEAFLPTAADCRRGAIAAIRDILGETRVAVELI